MGADWHSKSYGRLIDFVHETLGDDFAQVWNADPCFFKYRTSSLRFLHWLTYPVALTLHSAQNSAITRLITFIWAHWPGSPLLPVAVPMLLLFLQSVFNTAQSTSPVDTTVRAVNWIHRSYGHPEVIDATINNSRSGWAKMVSSRIRHTAMITTAQIAAMMAYAIEQNIEQNKHPSVVSIQLVFLRGSFSHFYRNV
jgi:hypothetical protein